MSDEPTARELEQAKRIAELEAQLSKPTIGGGGLVVGAANSIIRKIPRELLTLSLFAFMSYSAWGYYNEGKQLILDTERVNAEAAEKFAKAAALGKQVDGEVIAVEQDRAEIAKLIADARKAEAEAEAMTTATKDGSIQLATLRKSIEQTESEGREIQAKADALNQRLDGLTPLAIENKRLELQTLSADVEIERRGFNMMVNIVLGRKQNEFTDMMCALQGGHPKE